MPTISGTGFDEIEKMLTGLGEECQGVCARAVFKGAARAAEALKEAVQALPVEPFHPLPGAPNGTDPLNVVTEDDKEDLLNGIGVAAFGYAGDGADTAVGFNGYSRHKTKKYPNGVPIPMIARSIESGSSARAKRPFIRRTARAKQNDIQTVMADTAVKAMEQYASSGTLPPFEGGND